MGLFGKLFEKKECSICGGEIGLLGNRKLEDGNLCKACANKLSPWFDDRRHSTVAQIGEQLEYREANQKKVAAFCTTRILGEDTKVMLDEDAGVFMVTSSRNYQEENPDVLAFSDVTGCDLDIDEDRTEITRTNAEGEEISYNPPRYQYDYDFYMNIHVRNPYFDTMRFRLNHSGVRVEDNGGMRSMGMNRNAGFGVSKGGMNINFGGMGNVNSQMNPEQNVDFRRYREMGEEIKEALMQVRQKAREEMAAAAAPKIAVTCPFCGATTTPDANGCCEFCGGAVGR